MECCVCSGETTAKRAQPAVPRDAAGSQRHFIRVLEIFKGHYDNGI